MVIREQKLWLIFLEQVNKQIFNLYYLKKYKINDHKKEKVIQGKNVNVSTRM